MSDREFLRAAVLRRFVAGELTLRDATPLLGVSDRQAVVHWPVARLVHP
ncbi:MAG: hypothetical protein ACT4PJ_09680 [Gemmatimonadaceae bacterium]